MRAIYKYLIPVQNEFEIPMPVSSEVLAVQVQHGVPCIWCLLNPGNATKNRKFRIYPTGFEIPDKYIDAMRYVGTFQLEEGDFIGHLFEVKYDA